MDKKDCKNCTHFYRGASMGIGYNPFPCCHKFEDTGEYPNPLALTCFKGRLREKKNEKS